MRSASVAMSGERSLFDFAAERLDRLTRALGFGDRPARDMLERLSSPWATRPLGAPLGWRSEVGDDHSPLELSVAFGRTPRDHELRIMVEPLSDRPDLTSNARTTLATIDALAASFDIDATNLRRVANLFWPAAPQGAFAAWLAAGLSADGRWNFKIYLNPEATGRDRASAVVEEALVRLGFPRSWPLVANNLLTRELDVLKYFALDLSDGADARVKVYAKHFHARAERLEDASTASARHVRGEARRFLAQTAPDQEREFQSRGLFTCYSFVAGRDYPDTATTHFPINGYAPDDRVATERIAGALAHFDLDVSAYRRVIAAYANRPLDGSRGLHSYVSFRRDVAGPRVTIYLPVEAYRPGAVAAANVPEEPREPAQVVALYEQSRPMTDHPFLQRLRREPVDLHKLWVVMHNFQASISRNFARYLAQVTARIEDVRVRCILAEQLTEELGNGRWEDAHANLFCKLMDAIKDYAPARIDDKVSAPGAGFDRRLSAIYSDPDPYVGLGSMISGEIFGKQVDQFLAAEFRRQKEVDTEALEWLTLHERLEIEHAENSAELSTFVPEERNAAVIRGAMGMARAGYHFLDDLYVVCYGAAEPALGSAAE